MCIRDRTTRGGLMTTELMDRVQTFIQELSTVYPIRLDVQEHYKAIFFTEKKKRYAGITDDGTIVVRGLEVRRGDWCALAKELQSDVIKIILERREPKAAAELVTITIKKLRAGEIPLATVSYTHLRAHETRHDLVCRLLLEKKKKRNKKTIF